MLKKTLKIDMQVPEPDNQENLVSCEKIETDFLVIEKDQTKILKSILC